MASSAEAALKEVYGQNNGDESQSTIEESTEVSANVNESIMGGYANNENSPVVEEMVNLLLNDMDENVGEPAKENQPEAGGEESAPKRRSITFKSAPPDDAEAKKPTAILAGKFSKPRYRISFYNSTRYGQRDGKQNKEENDQEEEDNYIGMEFRSNIYEGVNLERQNRDPDQYHSRPYRPRRSNYWPKWKGDHDRIGVASVMPAEEADDMARRGLIDEYVPKNLRTNHNQAFPEDLVWIVVGQKLERLPHTFICPMSRNLEHKRFSKEQVVEEQWRMDLVYKMICEAGQVHIEELYKLYLERNKMDEHPFNGFTHFYQFITDRSHVFGIDQKHMVYNHNLLVSVAVLRYAHALYHGTPVIDTPSLFKGMGARLILRAFLSFMHPDDLSFDRFFRNFPAIFEFDEMKKQWKLREETVYTIPSAFVPCCLPRRDHKNTYVDRSQIVSGSGKVTANNLVKIKIQSEDTLRSGMPYMIGVPRAIVDDPNKYPVGTRVCFTGVRQYCGHSAGESVQGTRIELMDENPRDSNCLIDVFSVEEGDEEEVICVTETREIEFDRVLDVRSEIARKEEKRHSAVMNALAEKTVKDSELFSAVAEIFEGNWDNFKDFIWYHPYYYRVTNDNGTASVCAYSSQVSEVMTDFLIKLVGIEGRSYTKEEADKLCIQVNESLEESSRFTLNDLKEVIDYRKKMINSDGQLKVVKTVHPLCFWDVQHQMLMRL